MFHLYYTNLSSQLSLNSTLEIEEMINEYLIGEGISISNFSYVGLDNQFAIFEGESPNFDLDTGIVFGTGDIISDSGIIGPSGSLFSGQVGSIEGDDDLLFLAQSISNNPNAQNITSSHDLASIEFDFVSDGNLVQMELIYSSEEYTTWINTIFNDQCGVFVSGPGISGPFSSPSNFTNGSENFALVPFTDYPISVSTIYSDPGSFPDQLNAQYFNFNSNLVNLTLNGYTNLMPIFIPVIPGETYHIKIAIADMSDGFQGSALFLGKNSFQIANDEDGDGISEQYDCDDSNYSIYPGAIEIANNGIDEDCNGEDLITISIKELNGSDLNFYPNPSSEFIVIENNLWNELHVRLYDLTGNLIANHISSQETFTLDVSDLNSGIYLIQFEHKGNSHSSRFAKVD